MLNSLRSAVATTSVSGNTSTLRSQRLGNTYQFNQSRLDALSGLSAINAVRSPLLAQQLEAVSSDCLNSRYAPSADVRISKFGQVQSALASVKSGLDSLTKPEQRAPVKSSSSNDKIVSAESGGTISPPATFQIDITQLAQVQKLESASFHSADSVVGSGTLTFNFGRVNAITGEQSTTTKQATVTISAGDASLGGVANAINRADVGVRAEVRTENDVSRLRLTGAQTGAENAFTVSVRDNDTSSTDQQAGLSQLANNPVAVSGAGKNQITVQMAQDARLTINDRTIYSASNSVRDVATGTTISLTATGSATIELSRDREALTANVHKLVETFNTAREQLSAINDGQAKRELARLQESLGAVQSGVGLDRLSLADLGVDRNAGGGLVLNESRLATALDKNTEGVVGVMADVAAKLSNTVQSSLDVGNNLNAGLHLLTQQSSGAGQSVQGGGFSLLQSGGSAYSIPFSTLAGLQRYMIVARF